MQGLQLRTEQQGAVGQHGVVQRLHAEPVAREKQRLLGAVPERKGEHAAESIDAALPPALPGVHDDFGVAACLEDVPERLQLGDQRLIVVDLAIEDDDDIAILVVDRLLAGREIDDRETSVAERHPRLEMLAIAIRAAMRLRIVHPPQQGPVGFASTAQVDKSSDSAHSG